MTNGMVREIDGLQLTHFAGKILGRGHIDTSSCSQHGKIRIIVSTIESSIRCFEKRMGAGNRVTENSIAGAIVVE